MTDLDGRDKMAVQDMSRSRHTPEGRRLRSDERDLFGTQFESVRGGMSEKDVLNLLGEPHAAVGPGGTHPSPFKRAPTRIWYYGPNLGSRQHSPEPLWTVSFRNGRVLLLKRPYEDASAARVP